MYTQLSISLGFIITRMKLNSILFYEFICVLFWRVLISKRAAGNLIVSQALAMIKHILK